MKKTLTVLTLLSVTIFASAQRTIDISLDEIIQPTEFQSTSSGTTIDGYFSCKNNGTGTLNPGDTILFGFALWNLADNSLLLQGPSGILSQDNGYVRILTKTVAPQDTVGVQFRFPTQYFVRSSLNIRFGAFCMLDITADVTSIFDPDTINNGNFVDIVWWNEYRNGVSVDEITYNDNVAVYPNPASTMLNVELLLTSYDDVVVELIDINGAVVLSENVNSAISDRAYSVDVSSIANGLYIVKVTNGDKVSTSKVTISH
jgi:hypothetical protein